MTPAARRTPSRGDRLFAELTTHLRRQPGIETGRMLRSTGLKVNGAFFAFVGNDDRLILKLPRETVEAMVAQGKGNRVTMGTRTMREWIALPFPEPAPNGAAGDETRAAETRTAETRGSETPRDAESDAWTSAIEQALGYVAALPGRRRR